MRNDLKQTTWPEKMRAERDRYREFIERLARTEAVVPEFCAGALICPVCGKVLTYPHVTEGDLLSPHEDDCFVVEARRLLGWPVDEWGNLVEEE